MTWHVIPTREQRSHHPAVMFRDHHKSSNESTRTVKQKLKWRKAVRNETPLRSDTLKDILTWTMGLHSGLTISSKMKKEKGSKEWESEWLETWKDI